MDEQRDLRKDCELSGYITLEPFMERMLALSSKKLRIAPSPQVEIPENGQRLVADFPKASTHELA
ncbi:hypothetical protein Ciccas_005331 [Cichlidogyrus casuarinus]|uniref:Uncharacterized protein n=1 Tax=Cichlidogyrus casuarinus TaxID=1844966 RepID=A0ABD2Q9W5_9PLAT